MNKKNNRGYMLVEIIVAFTIAIFIMIFLEQITVSLKNKEEDASYKAIFESDKALMTKEVMDDVNKYYVSSIQTSTNNCEVNYICIDIKYLSGVNPNSNLSNIKQSTKLQPLVIREDDNDDDILEVSALYDVYKRIAISIEDRTFKYGNINEDGSWNGYVYTKEFNEALTLNWEISPVVENGCFRLKISAKTIYSGDDYGLDLVIFLLEYQPSVSLASYIEKLYNSGSTTTVSYGDSGSISQVSSVGLQKDEVGNIRYYGASPNNYVLFNEEFWRIIGVFNVEDENGNIEKRVKLIRNDSIGNYSYDGKSDGYGSSISAFGSNDWTDSQLMMMLNPGYEGEQTDSNGNVIYEGGASLYWNSDSGICYTGQENTNTSCDFTDIGLKENAKNMISQAKYYLGGSGVYSGLYANDYYTFERGTTVDSDHATDWIGYVGVMYPSDYAYATDLAVCVQDGYTYNTSTDCSEKNWLVSSMSQWTISPGITDTLTRYLVIASPTFLVSENNILGNIGAFYTADIRPVVYLKAGVLKSYGDGTIDNPYQLSV